MKLSEYLILHHLTPSSFAERVGLRSRTTIHRYIRGERYPSAEILKRIEVLTGGLVTARDFGRNCHANDNFDHLPWARRQRREWSDSMLEYWNRGRKQEGDTLSPPLRRAVLILGERVQVDRAQRNFKLDGRPVGAREVVKAANLRQRPKNC
jgi:transcriptional regulator with XRE-family HTH domain